MKLYLIKFSVSLFVVSGLSYFLHLYFFDFFGNENSLEWIQFCYKFNVGATFLFTSTTILFSKKFDNQIGFIFMLSGVLKLLIFFLVIKTSETEIERKDLLHFFIPYILCVSLEIFYLTKILKGYNSNKDK